jgi:pimeloyl-ACP methyl ester carboxylesterase
MARQRVRRETEVDQTMHMQHIVIDGHRLCCLVAGDPAKTPILMVHGWAHHPYIWASTMDVLSVDYYCIAVGLLGFGESDKPAEGCYTIAAHGRATLAIADAFGLTRFFLVGQSRGGQIVLWLAAHLNQDRIIAVVDISGVVTGRVSWYLRVILGGGMWVGYHAPIVFRGLRRVWSIPPVRRWIYSPYFARWGSPQAALAQQDGAFAFAQGADKVNWPAMREMCSTNLVPLLPQISAPTLVLFGKQDRVVPPSEGVIAAQHMQRSRLVLLDDCGHYPMVDQPVHYLRVLREFLDAQSA